MGYFINSEIGYYEGDRLDQADLDVPQRPSADHVWQGGKWVYVAPTVTAPTDAETSAARAALDALVTAKIITASARATMLPAPLS